MGNHRDQSTDEHAKKKMNANTVIYILVVLLIILCLFLIFTRNGVGTGKASGSARPSGAGLSIDRSAGVYIEKENSQTPGETQSTGGIAIPGWGSFVWPAGVTELDMLVDFFNPESNADKYYLTYEIRLPDDSEQGYEVLYSSQLIPPGNHIQSITISHPLDVGEFEAVIHVQPYRMDENLTPTNNADMKTKIKIVESSF